MPSNKKELYHYTGLGTQILAGLGLAVFIGLKADRLLHTLPLFSCILPLLVLGAIFYKLFRDVSARKKSDGQIQQTNNTRKGDTGHNLHYDEK